MYCKNCGYRLGPSAKECSRCGLPAGASPTGTGGKGDATGGMIPYKNAPALAAYYMGLFSVIPFLGFLLGLAAFIAGIMGLKKRAQQPEVKGGAHAWIGVGCGGLGILVWGAVIATLIAAALLDNP